MATRQPGFVFLGAAAVIVSVVASEGSKPLVLLNVTSSEPLGLYVRSSAAMSVGSVVAASPPPSARRYVHGRVLILKTIAALSGQRACRRGSSILVDGREAARAKDRDAAGAPLPRWAGCKTLRNEAFLMSNGSANSFDSRYFGPVPIAAVVGVYRRL